MNALAAIDAGPLRDQLAAWVAQRVAPQHVDDLVQEVFVRLGRADEVRHVRAYARRVALTVVADHHRARARAVEVELDEEPIEERAPSAEPGALIAAWLAAQVDHLPPELAQAIRECELGERSHADLARELGVPRSTISSRVQRGRAELLRMLHACCEVEREGGAVVRCTPHGAAQSCIG